MCKKLFCHQEPECTYCSEGLSSIRHYKGFARGLRLNLELSLSSFKVSGLGGNYDGCILSQASCAVWG